jgi:hypothetical protein
MARLTMTKEVTKTTVKVARMVVENGMPKAEPMDDVVMVGNISAEKAQQVITKSHGAGVTVFGVEPSTNVYKMDVADFIKYATLVTDEEAAETEQTEISA